MTIIWIVVAVVLAGGAFMAFRASKKNKEPKALPAPSSRTVLTMQVNDIVTHFNKDYICEAKLILNEDGFEWYDFMLVDGDDVVWLTVEEDDRLEVYLFEEVEDLNYTSKPPEHITYDGDKYQLEEWGRANVSRVGQTGHRKSGMACVYYDYEAPGGKYLSVEQWGEGDFEVSVGRAVRPAEFEILPGDDVAANI